MNTKDYGFNRAPLSTEKKFAVEYCEKMLNEILELPEVKKNNWSAAQIEAKLDQAVRAMSDAHVKGLASDGVDHTCCTGDNCAFQYGIEHMKGMIRKRRGVVSEDEINRLFAERFGTEDK